MAKSGTRIQVFFATNVAEEIEVIAKGEGVSLSKVVGDCIECYRKTDEYMNRYNNSLKKVNSIKSEILTALGPDLDTDKLAAVLAALDKLD